MAVTAERRLANVQQKWEYYVSNTFRAGRLSQFLMSIVNDAHVYSYSGGLTKVRYIRGILITGNPTKLDPPLVLLYNIENHTGIYSQLSTMKGSCG